MSWLRLIGWSLAGLVLTIALVLGLLLYTPWGIDIALAAARAGMPGELKVGAREGRLAGPLTLSEVSFRYEGVALDIRRISLDPALADLWSGRGRVDDLQVDAVRLELPPPSEPTDPAPLKLPALDLGVDAILDNAVVRDLSVHQAGATMYVLDRLGLSARLEAGVLRVENLDYVTEVVTAQLTGNIDTTADYAADLTVDWRSTATPRPAAGQIRIGGDLRRLTLEAKVRQPSTLAISGSVAEPLATPQWQARVRLDPTRLRALADGLPDEAVAADLTASGDATGLRAEGRITAAGTDWQLTELDLALDGGELVVKRLLVDEPQSGLHLEGDAHLALDGPLAGALSVHWQRLQWPLSGAAAFVSERGELHWSGRPEDYRVAAEARLAGPDLPAGRWVLRGRGSTVDATVERLTVATLDGGLDMSGHVDWSQGLAWRLQADGRNLDPSTLLPDWPGNLGLALTSSGHWQDGELQAELKLPRLFGRLRERPVRAQADLTATSWREWRGGLTLRSGSGSLLASGELGPDSDLTVRLNVPSLADFLPDAAGRVRADLRLEGPVTAPAVTGEIDAASLAAWGYGAEQLSASIDGRWQAQVPWRLRLRGQGLAAGENRLDRLVLQGDGTLGEHSLELSADGPAGMARVTVEGGLDGQRQWQGRLNRLIAEMAGLERWELARSVAIAAGPRRAAVEELCLRSAPAELCAALDWSAADGGDATVRLQRFPLARLTPMLDERSALPLAVSGSASLSASAQWAPEGPPVLRAELDSEDGSLRIADVTGDPGLLADYQALKLELTTDAEAAGLRASADLAGSRGLQARVDVRQPWADDPAATALAGRVRLGTRRLAWLQLVPGLAEPQGELVLDARLGGSLAAPTLEGRLEGRGLAVGLPALGIRPEGDLTLTLDRDDIELAGTLHSPPGRVAIDGSARLDPEAGWPMQVTVEGRDFQAMDTASVRARVSPELSIEGDAGRLDVNGEIGVPWARVDVSRFEGSVSRSPDVVVVGEGEGGDASGSEAPGSAAPAVSSELMLAVGDDVQLTGMGLEATLAGRLQVRERPDREPVATGRLDIAGKYEAYGQNLTIERGQLLYAQSALDNPGLSLRAVREVDPGRVGVDVSGTVRQPRLDLFSEPAMPDDEALAYLLLGRPLDAAGGGDTELSDLATKLGLSQGGRLAGRLGDKLGLDEAQVSEVDAAGGETTQGLVVGKYLSPRLYISYGIGLLRSASVVQLRYELTERWQLAAQSGEETRAALRFLYER